MRKIFAGFLKADSRLFLDIYSLSGKRFLDVFFYLVSRFGDGYCYAVFIVVLMAVNFEKGLRFAVTAAAAFVIESVFYFSVKKTVKRNRPFEKMDGIISRITPPDKFSFPSGHTAGASVMATVTAYFFPSTLVPVWLMATLIGFSRVYNGVHYPGDVFAGAGLGWGSAKISILIMGSVQLLSAAP